MHRVGYLITEGFQIMSLATQAVFEFANIAAGETVYKIQNFSVGGGTVRSSPGMYMDTLPLGALVWRIRMITGTLTPLTPPGDEVLASVRGFVDGARRIAGLCTGCFVLARPACWITGGPRHTGLMRKSCVNCTRRLRWKKTESSLWMARSGRPPE